MPNDSIWSRAYRTPFAGPYSAQAIVQGVGDAIGQPLVNDARAIKRVRNQYPTIDTLAGLHPVIAGAQVANDIAADDTGFDTAANIVQMIPAVKPLGLLAKQKAANIFGRRWGVDMPATLRRNAIITSGQVLGQTNDAE